MTLMVYTAFVCSLIRHLVQVHMRHHTRYIILGRGLIRYSWTLSTVLGQRSDSGTVLTSLTAMGVVIVMMLESAVNQVAR